LFLPLAKEEGDGPLDAPTQQAEALSFEAIYEKHFEFVWLMTRRFGVPPEATDDIVQEVFMVVHRKLATLQTPSAIRSWLYSIVRRCASGHHRRLRAVKHSDADVDQMPDIASRESPADLAERSDNVRQLWQLLDSLEAPKREIFIMAELGELSCPEIAEALDIPLNTAYSRLRHAREAFEAALARHRARTKGHV
jgi:RNA polymerase sigma-70 factor, ECF subfamily